MCEKERESWREKANTWERERGRETYRERESEREQERKRKREQERTRAKDQAKESACEYVSVSGGGDSQTKPDKVRQRDKEWQRD